jgi:hypothetical protein
MYNGKEGMDVKSGKKVKLEKRERSGGKNPTRESMVPCHCRRWYGKEERSPSFQKKVL